MHKHQRIERRWRMTIWQRSKFIIAVTNSLSVIEMNAKVTLGLCVKNSAKVVKTAFNSISIQDYPHELMKLVIVDDSSDNTLALAMEFAQETDIKTFVTSSKGKGLGATRQIVVDHAEGDYIVWVDDDLVLSKDTVRNHVEFIDKNPNVGAARGISIQVAPQGTISTIVEYPVLIPLDSADQKAFATVGAIFRLKALESVGGFDVQIKGAGEDLDISRRIGESGWKLAVNNSATFYRKYPPATLKALWKKNYWYGYGNHYLFHKYKDRQFLLQYFPPFVLMSGILISRKVYRVTIMKKVFVFFILNSFNMIANYVGFVCAHLDEYGHVKSARTATYR
jgi:glycosyltransferase involved in cell wall biosynthesis